MACSSDSLERSISVGERERIEGGRISQVELLLHPSQIISLYHQDYRLKLYYTLLLIPPRPRSKSPSKMSTTPTPTDEVLEWLRRMRYPNLDHERDSISSIVQGEFGTALVWLSRQARGRRSVSRDQHLLSSAENSSRPLVPPAIGKSLMSNQSCIDYEKMLQQNFRHRGDRNSG